MTLVAGVDSSTQSTKVVVCDADSGEVLRAQQTMLAQQLADRSVEEFAIPADELIAGYGPSIPVPPNRHCGGRRSSRRARGCWTGSRRSGSAGSSRA